MPWHNRRHPMNSGEDLGPYRILEKIGEGGMGEVYRAHDSRLQRTVAIKVLAPRLATPDRVERFEQEARAASALNHPNILTIHDVGRQGDTAYFAMEWVEGRTLRDELAGRARSASPHDPPGATDCRGARRGARRRHRPSRPQARERDGEVGRSGEDRRLRTGETELGAAPAAAMPIRRSRASRCRIPAW